MTEQINIPLPPRPHGTAQEQLAQLYCYLYQLAELLNVMKGGRE